MKKSFYRLLPAVFCIGVGFLVFGCQRRTSGASGSAAAAGPVTIELWYGAAMTEAGPPPKDWKALQIIKDKLNINLVLSALPSNESDQDVKINAAAAANTLPDLFMVRRDPFLNITKVGVIAAVDDLYPLMPHRTKVSPRLTGNPMVLPPQVLSQKTRGFLYGKIGLISWASRFLPPPRNCFR